MTLYLDSSALIKRYLKEDDSDVVRAAMDEVKSWSCCRIGFVETARAVGRAAGAAALAIVESEWISFKVIEVDHALSVRAAQLAVSSGLRSLDAMHLAAALELRGSDMTFATWDRSLHRAARKQGLRTLPAALA